MNKNDVFVKHIEQHLKVLKIPGKVMCKICNKDIDTIYDEARKTRKVTIYIDGSCKGNPGPGKSLALFISTRGEEWTREKTFQNTTNNRAEYEALKIALKECYFTENPDREVFDITIYTDSKLIDGHINKGWKVNTNFECVEACKKLIKDIKEIEEHLIKIKYVPREQNKAGKILEKEG